MEIGDARDRTVALGTIGAALVEAAQADAARLTLSEALVSARQVPEPDRSQAFVRLLGLFDRLDPSHHVKLVQQAANDLVKLGAINASERVTVARALARAGRYREARAMVAAADVEDHLSVHALILANYAGRRHPELAPHLDRISRERGFPRPDSVDDFEAFYEYLRFASSRSAHGADR